MVCGVMEQLLTAPPHPPCGAAAAAAAAAAAPCADNLAQEREMVCSMMEQLLTAIFTRLQAAHFLLGAHPYAWNGLAFAHAVASLHAG